MPSSVSPTSAERNQNEEENVSFLHPNFVQCVCRRSVDAVRKRSVMDGANIYMNWSHLQVSCGHIVSPVEPAEPAEPLTAERSQHRHKPITPQSDEEEEGWWVSLEGRKYN